MRQLLKWSVSLKFWIFRYLLVDFNLVLHGSSEREETEKKILFLVWDEKSFMMTSSI